MNIKRKIKNLFCKTNKSSESNLTYAQLNQIIERGKHESKEIDDCIDQFCERMLKNNHKLSDDATESVKSAIDMHNQSVKQLKGHNKFSHN